MITQMRLQNFKSWRDTGLMKLAPLTGLFGANSSGKTSLLQMLLLLKQTADSPDRRQVLNLGDDRSPVELGTFPDVLFRHNLSSRLHCFLEWRLSETLTIEDPSGRRRILFEGDTLGFSSEISWKVNGQKVDQYPPEWKLTAREGQVAMLVVDGQKNKQIADKLHVSGETVNRHLDRVYEKADVTGGKIELVSKLHEFRNRRSAEAAEEGGRAVVDKMVYRFSGETFGMKLLAARKLEYDLLQPESDFQFVRNKGRVWKLPPPARFYGFPDQVRGYYQNAGFLSDFELRFEELFSRLYYLGPLRGYPRREYAWAGAQPSDVGRRGENVIDALLASRQQNHTPAPEGSRRKGPQMLEQRVARLLGPSTKPETLQERVAQWLKDLGLVDSFEIRRVSRGSKLFQVWLRGHSRATEVLITDVGFGVSQILPVITLCYYAPEGSTVLLEQPEIHLHPSVQAGLADILIDAIKTRHIQVILESHSEHLLRRLQRRMAEGMIRRDEAAIYFCSMDAGESLLTTLKLDSFGNIENWPEDFFGDEMGEIAAMSRAVLARKRARA